MAPLRSPFSVTPTRKLRRDRHKMKRPRVRATPSPRKRGLQHGSGAPRGKGRKLKEAEHSSRPLAQVRHSAASPTADTFGSPVVVARSSFWTGKSPLPLVYHCKHFRALSVDVRNNRIRRPRRNIRLEVQRAPRAGSGRKNAGSTYLTHRAVLGGVRAKKVRPTFAAVRRYKTMSIWRIPY